MGNAPSISGQVSDRSHVPGDHYLGEDSEREQRPEQTQVVETDSEKEVEDMEVPDPRISYISDR